MRETRAGADNFNGSGAPARAWLRRVMPHVALGAALVVLAWVVVRRAGLERVGAVALFFDVAFVAVYLAALYYGVRALRWLKNRLLWRVRRRLAITYLFVGLTPVVLLAALAALTGLIGLNQLVSRVVKINLAARESQALSAARTLARGFAQQPAGADAKTIQAWLDDRVGLLQSTLPGARVAVWRGETNARGGAAGARRDGANTNASFPADENQPAQFASEPGEPDARAAAGDSAPASAPLPAWLRGKDEWHGMAFTPPAAGDASGFATPSLRALVRERAPDGRGVTLLLVVPVSRELVRQLRENTGLAVHPFFLGAEGTEVTIVRETFGAGKVSIGDQHARRRDPDNPNSGFFVVTPERSYRIDFRRDQFGEPTNTSSLVVLPAQGWADGRASLRLAFLCEFSALAVARQLFEEEGGVGRIFQGAITFVAVCFLILELLALLSAAWMTRAVTGTVHRLYQATEFIKRGDFSHRVRVRSHDQLGELAGAFNEMSADIETLLEERVEREKLEREIEIAAEVQAQLFPREVPRLAGAEIAGECRAARGVAGDYYDYIELQPGLIAFALADVSGKGISAALVMSNLQASLRAQTAILAERLKLSARVAVKGAAAGDDQGFEMPCGVAGLDTDCAVEDMAASINDQLCRSTDSNRFATVFLALYDDSTRRLRYTNAGHNAPFLVRAGGGVERLDVGGTVLGAFDWARYEEAAVALEPGDLLLVFSDGITEALDQAGEEYGDEQLAEFARSSRHLSTVDLRAAVFDEIDAWTGGRERYDDQTVVVLKARG
jgi:sigma-B regulation protein RsbU (phosphoserine phosphatase)